jgi:hypothetical protein
MVSNNGFQQVGIAQDANMFGWMKKPQMMKIKPNFLKHFFPINFLL